MDLITTRRVVIVVIVLIAVFIVMRAPKYYRSWSWTKPQRDYLTSLFTDKPIFTGHFGKIVQETIRENYTYADIKNSGPVSGYDFIRQVVFTNKCVTCLFGSKGAWSRAYTQAQMGVLVGSGISAAQAHCMVAKFAAAVDPIYFLLQSNDSAVHNLISSAHQGCPRVTKASFRASGQECVPSPDCTPVTVNPVFCDAVLASPNAPIRGQVGGLYSSGNVYQDIANCASYYQGTGKMEDPGNFQTVCDALHMARNQGSVTGLDTCDSYFSCLADQMCSGPPPSVAPVCSEAQLTTLSGAGCAQFMDPQTGQYQVPPQFDCACAGPVIASQIGAGDYGGFQGTCSMLKSYFGDPDCGSGAVSTYQSSGCANQCAVIQCPQGKTCDPNSLQCR